jgi:type I restriction enzyme M protein
MIQLSWKKTTGSCTPSLGSNSSAYLLANPPFGVEWKPQADVIEREHDEQGFKGRFGAGLPRINDGSLLFIMHMISKMKPEGSRLAIVFNGSPLFTGDAGSGESEIRRWIIESDWLEAIVALPNDMFYNTGISTFIWILPNRKRKERRGKVQLINAADLSVKMGKGLGNKRNELSNANIAEIVQLYGDVTKNGRSKVFDNSDFGYRQITVERPLRLAFQVTAERIAVLREEGAFQKLATSKKKGKDGQREIEEGQALQQEIVSMLEGLAGPRVDLNRADFEKRLAKATERTGIKLSTPLQKAILGTMSERDGSAEICLDTDGNPEPDTELRDHENVPLKEDIHAYVEREVLPHVPDAWIDESKTRVGYEIPFNRHFYKYTPPRPFEEIKAEIKTIEQDILRLLAEVAG